MKERIMEEQRQIKFRVWDNTTQKFDDQIYNAGEQFGHPSSCDWIAQQFTGLKDFSGKEVYEGDIIKYKIGNKKFANYIVVFEDGAFFAKNDIWGRIYADCMNKKKIIGNIFENPDLLK